jgi:hypothetical protein
MLKRRGRRAAEKSNYRDRKLLRVRYKRPPSRRASEQRDELATPHGVPSTGQGRILPHRRARKPMCIAAKSDHSCPSWHFRTTPSWAECPLSPTADMPPHLSRAAMCHKRTHAPQQTPCTAATFYSITSSARASRVGGISRPSALAVFRLITSSYLVGACTGRSAGFSPLRMRST